MNTEPKKGIEATDTAHKAYTKRTIAIGIASVALVATLGIGAAYAHGGLNRKPNPPAGESTAAQAKEETQEKVELTAQEVADATGDLHFAGDDVSASSNTTVSIKDGHVMVTETSEDTAANNVWYAPRRAAAMAERLKDTTIKADSEEEATDIKMSPGSLQIHLETYRSPLLTHLTLTLHIQPESKLPFQRLRKQSKRTMPRHNLLLYNSKWKNKRQKKLHLQRRPLRILLSPKKRRLPLLKRNQRQVTY